MDRSPFPLFALVACLCLAPPAAQAENWNPIGEHSMIAFVQISGEVWLVPSAREAALEDYAGTQATVCSMDALLDAIEGGWSPSALRFEGCHADATVAARLAAEGYDQVTEVVPQVEGSSYARRYAP